MSAETTNMPGPDRGPGFLVRWGLFDARWGPRLLLAAAAILLAVRLGARELWTHEGRWAAVCLEMDLRGDYLHPYLLGEPYYDKPLLSYWLMLACARLWGALDEVALRLPSILAAVLAVWATYRLGRRLAGVKAGLVAGWILTTAYYFVFWGRVASADMLNVAGTVGLVAWFYERREKPSFVFYLVFFLLGAVTALMKGLVGPAVAFIALLPGLAKDGEWKRHIHLRAAAAALPALAVYLAPFLLSRLSAESYGQEGLELVFRENIVRFFRPFDHKGSIFTYFIYLPLYLLPWSLLFTLALPSAVRRWKALPPGERLAWWAALLVFLFLTASGSRRSYYVLPLLPLAAVALAARITSIFGDRAERWSRLGLAGAFVYLGLLGWYGLGLPYFEERGGVRPLASAVRREASAIAPWPEWEVWTWGAPPKAAFYLRPETPPRRLRAERTEVRRAVRELLERKPRTVLLVEYKDLPEVLPAFRNPRQFLEPSKLPDWLGADWPDRDTVVALYEGPEAPDSG